MKIVFLTGTRADFGKIKPLIKTCEEYENIDTHVFITGMHMLKKFGRTYKEVERSFNKNTFKYFNTRNEDSMELALSKTIEGFSLYIDEIEPSIIVVHGDRIEALAGALVGSLKNIRVIHIEGGEVSGTIDDSLRHAISKLSQIHLVSNQKAQDRLIQMGEDKNAIKIIGSPDIDVMFSDNLPDFKEVLSHYEIPFTNYGIFMYHPVTTEINDLPSKIVELEKVLNRIDFNLVIIYPNNDLGSNLLIQLIDKFKKKNNFKIYPSINFESFLVLLKHSKVIIGNSSAGIREAPHYDVPTVNIGTRQNGRAFEESIIDTGESASEILTNIKFALEKPRKDSVKLIESFGEGNSSELFKELIEQDYFSSIPIQKKLNYD